MNHFRFATRAPARATLSCVLFLLAATAPTFAQPSPGDGPATLTIDVSPAGRRQVIDGFGTALNDLSTKAWYQALYLDDLHASIARFDLTPRFRSPVSDSVYYTPWFGSAIPFPGPDRNNARTYTGPHDYSREFGGFNPPIAVMGPDIDANITLLDLEGGAPLAAGLMGQAMNARRAQLGDSKIIASIFSPAPWLKIASGNSFKNHSGVLPTPYTPYPFVWNGNFAGGYLDVSGVPLDVFFDGLEPTSALTQFARSTVAYLRGFQQRYGVNVYAVSIQNELNFEQFFNSCSYPLTHMFAAALKVLRAELDKYPDLAPIRLIGPEDLLIETPWSLWQFGGGDATIHKNLRYLHELESDPEAVAALDFFAVHASVSPQIWSWWVDGWTSPPHPSLPETLRGFQAYGKKSWMTETSGHASNWPAVGGGSADQGALAMATSIHRALTTGMESAWLHWQFAENGAANTFTLTDATQGALAPKFVAAKHFVRYIRPDAQRVEVTIEGATDVLASAYLHEADRTLTVVLVNRGAIEAQINVSVPASPVGVHQFDAFTSQAGSLWQASVVNVARGVAPVPVPAFGLVTLTGTGTGRLVVDEGAYELVARHTGLVLDNAGAGGVGTQLIQWPSHGGANQRFTFRHAGDGWYKLICASNGLPIGVAGSMAAAAPVVIETDDPASPYQLWGVTAAADGYVTLTNKGSGQVLDVYGASRNRRAKVIQWPAHGRGNQQWLLRPLL